MNASYRKRRTFDVLYQNISKTLDRAQESGEFEAFWDIPNLIIQRKTYFMLFPLIEKYRKEGYIVDFYGKDGEEKTQLYFSWFDVEDYEIKIKIV